MDRGVRLIGRSLGCLLSAAGLALLVVALTQRTFEGFLMTFAACVLGGGASLLGIGDVLKRVRRKRAAGGLARGLNALLEGGVEADPDQGCARWRGRRRERDLALLWILDNPSTLVSLQIEGGSPGLLRLLPRGGWMKGGRALPVGHAAFDQTWLARSEPASLLGDLFNDGRRDVLARTLLGLPFAAELRLTLGSSDLRLQLPRVLRRGPELHALMDAAALVADAIRDTARSSNYHIISVGAGTSARCPVCLDPLEADVVLCVRCRTPHHRGCWDYVHVCSMFACGGRRWVLPLKMDP